MRHFYKKTVLVLVNLLFILTFLCPSAVKANNLSLSALTFADPNVTFTISWENSWYANTPPNNWDAVWLFVKYKDCTTTNWLHASLSAVPADHTVSDAVNYELETVSDDKGIFVKRKIAGTSGNVAAMQITLKLNIPAGTYNFKVFGIEMVKVLNENFDVGDGAATNRFNSVSIASENAVTAAVLGGAGTVDLPAAYPKGWNAFYSMKYEVTNEQYVDFLNTLTYDQQASRTEITPNSAALNWAMSGQARNSVKISTQGVASTTPAIYACDGDADNTLNESAAGSGDCQNVPISRLSWADLCAYLDWACLRPMTDLEFEKICRGPMGRIANEYAWGNNTSLTYIVTGGGSITNWGSYAESKALTTSGRCVYFADTWENICPNTVSTSYGPARAGVTVTAATTRVQGGTSYYGVLDMSGNLEERVVATNAAGSTFTGTFGDGDLSTTNADWPNAATASGTGYRGGDWYTTTTSYLQVSDRSFAVTTDATRSCIFGGRGVR